PGSPPPSASPSAGPSPAAIPPGFVEVRDDGGRFSIAYPAGWKRLGSPDPDVRLVAAGAQDDSLLVRTTRLGFRVGAGQLPAVRKLTDRIVQSGKGVRILSGPQEVEVGGLPGWFYFYSFKDPATGRRGAHSHYFLFRGRTMLGIVFQTIPAERFPRLAPVFDQIVGTFQPR
ncbi:MAG: hypothetical protein ABR575_01170, partial [Actinomycetota bacterium]